MKVWLASRPALSVLGDDGPPVAAFYDPSTGIVFYGDDGSGDTVTMEPNGTLGRRANSERGDWQKVTVDAPNHCFQFFTWQNVIDGGIGFKVPFCAR